jgi:hypothetical protein
MSAGWREVCIISDFRKDNFYKERDGSADQFEMVREMNFSTQPIWLPSDTAKTTNRPESIKPICPSGRHSYP